MSAKRSPKVGGSASEVESHVIECSNKLLASIRAEEVWEPLRRLAKKRDTLSEDNKRLIRVSASKWIASDREEQTREECGEESLYSVRTLVYSILGDEEATQDSLAKCLKMIDLKGRLAAQFGELGIARRPKRRSKSAKDPSTSDTANLHNNIIMHHNPGMAEAEHAKKGSSSRRQQHQSIDLDQEFFSLGAEAAKARLLHLTTEAVSRFPTLKDTLKSELLEAIDGRNGKATETILADCTDVVELSDKLARVQIDIWEADEDSGRGEFERRKDDLLKGALALGKDYPVAIKAVAEDISHIADTLRPPSTERTLNLQKASERSNLSIPYLSLLCRGKKLGDGSTGKPRFSEAELDEFVAKTRKRGPKPKAK